MTTRPLRQQKTSFSQYESDAHEAHPFTRDYEVTEPVRPYRMFPHWQLVLTLRGTVFTQMCDINLVVERFEVVR